MSPIIFFKFNICFYNQLNIEVCKFSDFKLGEDTFLSPYFFGTDSCNWPIIYRTGLDQTQNIFFKAFLRLLIHFAKKNQQKKTNIESTSANLKKIGHKRHLAPKFF